VKEFKSEFDRRGVSVVVVSFAQPTKLVHYQELHRWPFPIIADPERKAYRAFDLQRLSLFRVFSPATLKRYLQLLFKGMKQEPYGGEDIYQSDGDFLLDRRGNILFAHRSQDPADRPAPAKLLEEIDRFRTQSVR
jgi:peroxiredoxin